MNQKLIKDSEMLAEQLEDEANRIFQLLIKARSVIENLTDEYIADSKALDNVIAHSKEKEKKNKEDEENLWSIVSLYRALLGEETATLIENSAKRFLKNAKKEKGEKELE